MAAVSAEQVITPETGGSELPNPIVMVIGHLQMICLAAKGEYRPRRVGEIEDRQKVILTFLRTGQLIAGEEDAELLGRLKEVFSDAITNGA